MRKIATGAAALLATAFAVGALLSIFNARPVLAVAFPNTAVVDSNGNIMPICNAWAGINDALSTTQQVIAPVAGQRIIVCSIIVTAPAAASITTLTFGTGATCGTGTVTVGGGLVINALGYISLGSGNGQLISGASGAGFCVTTNSSSNITGFVSYAQEP